MFERHPFDSFVPTDAKYLILGSFVANQSDKDYSWYYSSKRNQFWQILQIVYSIKLDTKRKKMELFKKLKIAVSDIIYQCERKNGSSMDSNLINIVYNLEGIRSLLENNRFKKVFFTSKFVERKFRIVFKEISLNYPKIKYLSLPSPSPRYAFMSLDEKAKIYKKLLPVL